VSEKEENDSPAVTRKIFLITVISAVVFSGVVFSLILPNW